MTVFPAPSATRFSPSWVAYVSYWPPSQFASQVNGLLLFEIEARDQVFGQHHLVSRALRQSQASQPSEVIRNGHGLSQSVHAGAGFAYAATQL